MSVLVVIDMDNFCSYGNISSVQTPCPETLEAWTALLTAHRRLTDELDADLRAEAGMALDEYDVLYQVRRAGRPIRMSELARQVLISRPSTTRVVDRLVERGWLDRTPDPHDRRVVLVGLTAAGRRAQARAGRVHLDGISRRLEGSLSPPEIAALAHALGALTAAGG
jgi:DNA-binding MarR family transcriptional regulator